MPNEKVLIIDDCRVNVLLLKHVLSKINVQADSAGSGESGIELAVKGAYPLIFVDIMMPGIDGLETCRRLRAHPFKTKPCLLLLTAMGEKFSADSVEEVGADGVFFKPIVPSQIIDVVKETMGLSQ